jgi:uncharacterized cupredoxin-like copper-binding protein
MHVISIAGSEHQKSRLRNGHKVRVKHGAGFNVVVNPNTYHLVSRAFNKNKGTTLQLSPEEIAMNRAPSPEMQRQIMGHNEHLILPNAAGELIKGSGIKDWFKNLGHQIKSKVIDPIKEKVYEPVKDLYEKNVPSEVRRDIGTAAKFGSPIGLLASTISRLKKGDKIQDIGKDYFNDLKHLNETKNKIIKSNPALTEAYKKGVMATAGIGSAALGTTLGLNPATGALLGAAGAKGAQELLKAEGYGLHHAIDHGIKHHYDELKHLARPIGGRITLKHVKDFFVNAGRKLAPAFKQGAKTVHNFILDNPELAKKIKEHGAKLAGAFAKAGVNYLSGNEKYGEQAENLGSKFGEEQIHKNLGYGLHSAIEHGEKHHYNELKHHARPIGGKITFRGIKDFFVNAGRKLAPVVKQGAQTAHNFILANPELAKKIKEHGSKLAGMLAKMGANYLTGDEKYGEQAEKLGSKFGEEQIHKNLGYGLSKGPHRTNTLAVMAHNQPPPPPAPLYGKGLTAGVSSGNGLGTGLYAGKMRGTGPFHSFNTLKDASDAYANANAELADMSRITVHNQHTQKPIQAYYESDNAPPSRGYGIHPHTAHHIHQKDHLHHREHTRNPHDTNLIRGRGTLVEHDAHLPPALVSQPYGSNFHMQFQLPPQYQKYNDGTYTY